MKPIPHTHLERKLGSWEGLSYTNKRTQGLKGMRGRIENKARGKKVVISFVYGESCIKRMKYHPREDGAF